MIATVTLNPSLDEWVQLPVLRLGTLNRATGFARYPGGKGINVSRVVHELGGRTVAFGVAGGEDGAILRRGMRSERIPHVFVEVDGLTRNNYKLLTGRPRRLTELNTPGPRVSLAILRQLTRRVLGHTPRPIVVALCGSLPPGAPSATYRRLIHTLHRRRIPAVLDGSGEALRQGLAARPWLIKPNRHEAEELLRVRILGRRGIVRAARQLLARGASLVILSLGREGAVLASCESRAVWWATPPAVRVESAVGAGDSLVGGFLVGWRQRLPLLEAFRLGVAAGTAAAMTSGTQLCRRQDVRRLLGRIVLRQVA